MFRQNKFTENWLHGSSKMLCGHSVIAEQDKIGEIISKLKDKTDSQKEIKQLPGNKYKIKLYKLILNNL